MTRIVKLSSKSMYYVARLLPTVITIQQVKKDVKSLEKAISLLDSINHDFIAPPTENLKEDFEELKGYLNGFKYHLREDLQALSHLNLFSEAELNFINNLIDN